ncbi:hypothetical protein AWB71_06016 [Caballeronia peredens]|nr:hypothetical protein AWB71_06016 [Caballeronia peredens]
MNEEQIKRTAAFGKFMEEKFPDAGDPNPFVFLAILTMSDDDYKALMSKVATQGDDFWTVCAGNVFVSMRSKREEWLKFLEEQN